jgi:hypothetical protein
LSVANANGSTTVSASSDNSSHISVALAPNQSATVTGSGSVAFIATMSGNGQKGTITFAATTNCGATATVSVNP